MRLRVRRLTPALWPAVAELFGSGNGPCGRCWCMYWRIGAAYRGRSPAANSRAFREIVRRGPPPGLLAFDGPKPVGWCQLTPRGDLPWLNRQRRFAPVGDARVWSITCFVVHRGYRGRGITSVLIAEALRLARRAGAPAVEAYPVDANRTNTASSTGFVSTFWRAGFRTVARHVPSRPIMRYVF